MASDIFPQHGRGGAAPPQPPSPASATLPPSITKTKAIHYDAYTGPAADLIAAGLVRADQFPPPGRTRIAFLHGSEVRGRCKVDETYLRIERRDNQTQVRIGVSVDIARHRRAAEALKRKSLQAFQAAQDNSKELAAAIEALRAMVLSMREPIEPGPETEGD
jgi:hypothetical protein